MEQDIHLAASGLRQVKLPPPLALVPALHQEIERAAASCNDAMAVRRLRKLIDTES